MKRRSITGGNPTKGRARKAAKPRARNPPKGAAGPTSSSAAERTEIGRLTRELDEALERQTAASEVLQTISRYPGDLDRSAHAGEGSTPLRRQVWEYLPLGRRRFNASCDAQYPCGFGRGPKAHTYSSLRSQNPVGHMIATKSVVHVDDAAASEAYIENDPATVAAVDLGSTRTFVAVPILKENELLGAFALARRSSSVHRQANRVG